MMMLVLLRRRLTISRVARVIELMWRSRQTSPQQQSTSRAKATGKPSEASLHIRKYRRRSDLGSSLDSVVSVGRVAHFRHPLPSPTSVTLSGPIIALP